MTDALVLDGQPLTFADVEAVARAARTVSLGDDARSRIDAARSVVEAAADGHEPVYGVNTGFGSLSRVQIDGDGIRDVQRNLIRSHAAGVGEPLPNDVVRAMMLILAASLCRGHSGVRVSVVEHLLGALDRGLTPMVPSRGSVGASGDLAPLSHLVLGLLEDGLVLEAKEGLALINGTHMMSAMGALALADIERLLGAAIAAAAMAVDACRGSDVPFDERLHDARNQPGQRRVAALIRAHLVGSSIVASHRQDDPRVQDPYCLRAAPQVIGAALDTLAGAAAAFAHELGGVTDNPLVFVDGGDILSGGNFHGMPVAIAHDTMSIALCHVAGIAERRVNWLLTASDSENPVNPYLSPQPGLHSGMMITQYTAAACCNELQTLATPASVGNIPTSAGMEDYNSMGATAAHQTRRAVDLATSVVAIELLVMAEAIEYQRPLKSGDEVESFHAIVREVVPRLTEDRPPAPDIEAIAELIRGGRFGSVALT